MKKIIIILLVIVLLLFDVWCKKRQIGKPVDSLSISGRSQDWINETGYIAKMLKKIS